MDGRSDKELLEAMRSGDAIAFQSAFDRHWKPLFSFVFRMIDDEDQTKDILQNTFLELWNRRETLLINDSLFPYLVKVAKNDVISLFRRDKVRLEGVDTIVKNLQRSAYSDERLLTNELQQAIDKELTKMPVNMQRCFQLSKYENKSIRDISAELLLSEQTVKNNISDALRRLRQVLSAGSSGYLAVTALLLSKLI